jgi:hypothetical protein
VGPRGDLVLPGFEPRTLQPRFNNIILQGACMVWRLVYGYPALVTVCVVQRMDTKIRMKYAFVRSAVK